MGKIKIVTSIDKSSGEIIQEISTVALNSVYPWRLIQRNVIATGEEHIRKALIELGWRPPQ